MKGLLSILMKLFVWGSAILLWVVAATTIFLLVSGTVDKKRLSAALDVLRGRKPAEASPHAGPVEEEWKDLDQVRQQMELTHRAREADLNKLQDLNRNALVQIETERKRLEKERLDAEKKIAEAKKAVEDLQKAKIDAVTEANLPIYEQMEADGLIDLMSTWSTKEIVKYLRLMKPAKSAEVLEAMRGNPKYSAKPQGGGASMLEQIGVELQR